MPLVIGIAGGTCAGKSRLAEGLAAHYANAALLAMDSFYRQQPPEAIAAGIVDFDSPEALDLDAMAAALKSLRAGRAVEIPVYDRAASRAAGLRTVSPHAVLLVEGLFAMRTPTDTVQVVARMVNCTGETVSIEARSSFMNNAQIPTEPDSAWKTVQDRPSVG